VSELTTKKESNPIIVDVPAKPFLRWAGGKKWLIKHLNKILPKNDFKSYHEPFLGGAAIFISLNPKKAYLSDLNRELIDTYRTLKNRPEEIITELANFDNSQTSYYKIRCEQPESDIRQAARFIYLNQTSYNGIYRVNLKGQYNVPFGFRKKDFLEPDVLRAVSKSLRNADIIHGDFDLIKPNIQKRDLIFLDPPYTVSHNSNGFIKYNQKIFSLEDQYRLSTLIDHIKSKDAYYILTNAAHHKILDIFEKGDKRLELTRANLIGGINAHRGKTSEYLFTNIKSIS